MNALLTGLENVQQVHTVLVMGITFNIFHINSDIRHVIRNFKSCRSLIELFW